MFLRRSQCLSTNLLHSDMPKQDLSIPQVASTDTVKPVHGQVLGHGDGSISVYDGSKWLRYTFMEMVELNVHKALLGAGYSDAHAADLIKILKQGHP
jgi:hypothetical protein